jgi:hypothetical protein
MDTGRYTSIVVGVAACLFAAASDAEAQVGQAPEAPKSAEELAGRLGVKTLSKGSSSWNEKRKALKELPLGRLNQQQRARADLVLRSVSQFRRLPTIQTPIEPAVFHYFLNHPDVAVSLWRVMGISEFKLWQTSDFGYQADAGDGSNGSAEFLYRDNQQCILACEGLYQNPMLKNPIQARALVHMRYQFQSAGEGQLPILTQQVNAYISFPSTAVKTVAKVISPVTNKIMDRNCVEITVFLKVMSDSMETRPQWIQSMAAKMDGVMPARRTELAELAASVNTGAKARSIQGQLGRARLDGGDPRNQLLPITSPSGNVIRRASRQRTVPRR